MRSNSWVLVEFIYVKFCPYRTTLPIYAPPCVPSPYRRDEIARAGLWSACYRFPFLEYGHTDPYCADFVDDFYQARELLVTQMMCVLSFCLACFGILAFGFGRISAVKSFDCSSSAFVFLGAAGLCGLAGCICVHVYFTQDFVVLFYANQAILFKWWAFHMFMDGSLLYLAAWLISFWDRKKVWPLKR